ncbi:MAG: tRNA lysidine(34) synthetase TilS [Clostridiales bacterium]|nr:tRNA lysidine(34) synthetase TilS [Clostridiales bacterium]
MQQKIYNCIVDNKLIDKNDDVIVGFSGGADSVALLYSLKILGYNVKALHIEHGIRGDEALHDADFTKDFCLRYNIEYFIEHINVPEYAEKNGLSLETSARIERYRIFSEYSKKYSCPVAVAHNKNDQAETVLMHLLRGSGLNGLVGMKPKFNNIIRPMLDITRDEIEVFNAKNNLPFVIDSTNYSNEYTRNKIRNNVIPVLNEVFNTNCVENIAQCSKILNEYNQYFFNITEKYAKEHIFVADQKVELSICAVPRVIFIELIKKAIELLCGNIVDIERIHLENIFDLINKESGKEVHLPCSIKAKKVYNKIIFTNINENFEAKFDFKINDEIYWKNYIIKNNFVTSVKKQPFCEHLDFDKLPNNLVLRTRKSGDFIYPLGSNGKCTIKKYFIDKKIPSDIRNSIPLLASGNEIFAIIGYTVSQKAKITENTKKIIKIFMENNNESSK